MSNANRIHLLSLAAGTLNHIANVDHYHKAQAALDAVLADIVKLTETGAEKASSKDKPDNPAPEASGSSQQAVADQPACGCGKPECALIDVLLGKRSDYTVTGIVDQFVVDFGLKEASGKIISALDFLHDLTSSGEYVPTEADTARLQELAQLGAKFAAEALAEKLTNSLGNGRKPQVHVVDGAQSLEAVLESIFGKRDSDETRH